ncbi:MAG: NADPH-dependent oxidoreductase [Rhodospirillaceae bacterium]|jgi:nitroreductase/FMN reductase [NAD(P)H]|nr:NADPH-dependent oxidoreductase [Rhodospirillaceae bacterium]MBT4687454.1 NADPH-dependent oxidoreductase [Rhodospirillaceae bacterium]MBT5080156.1 NADPH-dependent oxidoreductase [Rhodospirillaceae bacterium]MBT5527145.1 NADPH-dependent oxidoreductase [Rhodospirillaceae bacterium]MBT5882041.1 NADPH-dependent oxidoreductase [Rhodospirillaceae bacterium]
MGKLADLAAQRFGMDTNVGEVAPGPGQDTLAALLSHRTHRRFLDDPVAEETLNLLYACALSAPAKSDLQQIAIIRIQDPEKRAAIAALMPDMGWIGTCPVFLLFCGDSRRIRRLSELRGHPFANDHLDAFLNAAVDTGLVLQNFITAAEAAGLGCCPISVVRNHINTIAEITALPDYVFPLAGMCLGYPAHPGFTSTRLPPEIVVHTDQYDDSQLPEQIDAYDHRRHGIYTIPPEKYRKMAEYGEVDFYGWSEDKTRQVSVRERDDLADYLRRHKFTLE